MKAHYRKLRLGEKIRPTDIPFPSGWKDCPPKDENYSPCGSSWYEKTVSVKSTYFRWMPEKKKKTFTPSKERN